MPDVRLWARTYKYLPPQNQLFINLLVIAVYRLSLPILSISMIRIEDYLFCPSYHDHTVSHPHLISKAHYPSHVIESFLPRL
jgi:hypothetical protein